MLKDKERLLALKLVLSEFSTLVFNQHHPVPHAIPISEKRKRKPPNSRGTQSLMSECHCPLSPGRKPESGTAAQTRILSSDNTVQCVSSSIKKMNSSPEISQTVHKSRWTDGGTPHVQ